MNDERHPEAEGLGGKNAVGISHARPAIWPSRLSSQFQTNARRPLLLPPALIVCRRVLGLGLQGIVMIDKGEGGQGLDHAGDDPGDDDSVLVFADCSHSGEDEHIHDEGLQNQKDRRHNYSPGVPVRIRSLSFWFAGRLEAGIGEEPDADSEEYGGKRQGEEDRHGAQAEAQSCDQDCRGQAQIEGIMVFRLARFGYAGSARRLRWLVDRLAGLVRLVVRGGAMLFVWVADLRMVGS